MLVMREAALKNLMHMIINSTHDLVDTVGVPQTMGTIPESQLRMAAIVAVQIATGLPIWPGDRPIEIRRRKQTDDLVVEVG